MILMTEIAERMKNYGFDRYLLNPFILKLIAAVETAVLSVSIIGWPLIAFSMIPISYDLENCLLERRLYMKWRFLCLVLFAMYYIGHFPVTVFLGTSSSTTVSAEGIMETAFCPTLVTASYFSLLIVVLFVQILSFTITIILPCRKDT